jgi:hypothetical protein
MPEPEMAGLGAAESEVLNIVWELKEAIKALFLTILSLYFVIPHSF